MANFNSVILGRILSFRGARPQAERTRNLAAHCDVSRLGCCEIPGSLELTLSRPGMTAVFRLDASTQPGRTQRITIGNVTAIAQANTAALASAPGKG
ncbi:hypothetical protein HNR60_003536 [Rhodopseudomonas rhenobacensis]|uniref:Uncharacterized protein n=1 Tax=Rhodopseudomonas rhenobacensis TaxID=87461 RepID=A0A7W7Z6A8_9BRAD|nr:hypothetical protein [Rhodopseudomonas rhenobacensis]